MLSDEWLSRYVKFDKLDHKTLTQRTRTRTDTDGHDRGDYNSSTVLREDELKTDKNSTHSKTTHSVSINDHGFPMTSRGRAEYSDVHSTVFDLISAQCAYFFKINESFGLKFSP